MHFTRYTIYWCHTTQSKAVSIGGRQTALSFIVDYKQLTLLTWCPSAAWEHLHGMCLCIHHIHRDMDEQCTTNIYALLLVPSSSTSSPIYSLQQYLPTHSTTYTNNAVNVFIRPKKKRVPAYIILAGNSSAFHNARWYNLLPQSYKAQYVALLKILLHAASSHSSRFPRGESWISQEWPITRTLDVHRPTQRPKLYKAWR